MEKRVALLNTPRSGGTISVPIASETTMIKVIFRAGKPSKLA